MNVKLVHITPKAEEVIAYCARVSSPNQENPEYKGLLKYCIKHAHWSVFEMATICVEITTSRAIAQQILRHRSFHFQEFSQRYAEATEFEVYEARRQDLKNRQNSIADMSEEDQKWFTDAQDINNGACFDYYQEALKRGLAKEQARMFLPLNVQTKMYMHGTIRDFIHYINVRTDLSTQKEHRDIALAIKEIFKNELPIISKALTY